MVELQLITSILGDIENYQTFRKSGITAAHISAIAPEAALILEFINNYYDQNRKLPAIELIQNKFPKVVLPYTAPNIDDLIFLVRDRYLVYQTNQIIFKASKALETQNFDIRKILQEIRNSSQVLLEDCFKMDHPDPSFERHAYEVMEEYQYIKEKDGLIGAPWPWEIMNKHSRGMVKGEYILIYGLTKSMKTWLALYLVVHLWKTTNYKIIIYIKEMRRKDLLIRLALLITEINGAKFSRGELSKEEEDKLQTVIDWLAKSDTEERLIIVEADTHLSTKELREKIRKYNADVLFADSVYLMKDERSKSRTTSYINVSNISGDLRDLADSENVLVITTSQEHERSARIYGRSGGASIGYASKLLQDSDLVIHIFKFWDSKLKEFELGITVPYARNIVSIPDFTIRANPGESFAFKRRGIKDVSEEVTKIPTTTEINISDILEDISEPEEHVLLEFRR